jgi:hypothetical protein
MKLSSNPTNAGTQLHLYLWVIGAGIAILILLISILLQKTICQEPPSWQIEINAT